MKTLTKKEIIVVLSLVFLLTIILCPVFAVYASSDTCTLSAAGRSGSGTLSVPTTSVTQGTSISFSTSTSGSQGTSSNYVSVTLDYVSFNGQTYGSSGSLSTSGLSGTYTVRAYFKMEVGKIEGGVTTITGTDTASTSITVNVNVASYTVTFDLNGGSRTGGGGLTQTVSSGGSATAPNVSRTGYNFDGWSGNYSNVTSNRTITAQWSRKSYTVMFDLAGGTRTGGGNISQTVYYGNSATAPALFRTGYNFDGWDGNYTNITSSRTITALWTRLSYTVNFDLAGGNLDSGEIQQLVYYGDSAVAPIVSRAGYRFNGWSMSVNNITASVVITASWTPIIRTVTYFVNNGYISSGVDKVSVQHGTLFSAITAPALYRPGYKFRGWSADLYAFIPVNSSYCIDSDLSVYAWWTSDTDEPVPDPLPVPGSVSDNTSDVYLQLFAGLGCIVLGILIYFQIRKRGKK